MADHMFVELLVTEHPLYLSRAFKDSTYKLARRLEEASGLPVDVTHYLDVGVRARQTAMVVGGSVAPWATHDRSALDRLGEYVCDGNVPILGICAGMQLLAEFAGGHVSRADQAEYGYHGVDILTHEDLFAGLRPAHYDVSGTYGLRSCDSRRVRDPCTERRLCPSFQVHVASVVGDTVSPRAGGRVASRRLPGTSKLLSPSAGIPLHLEVVIQQGCGCATTTIVCSSTSP